MTFGCKGKSSEAEKSTLPIANAIYATSTDSDYFSYGVENLFDANKSTIWKSMPGAGFKDGVMISFEDEVYIEKIDIIQPISSKYDKITSFRIFVNGSIQNYRTDGIDIQIRQRLNSIYVQIIQTDETTSMDNDDREIEYKNSSKPVAISDILIDDKAIRTKKLIPGSIEASSTLQPQSAYNTDFLFDSRSDFAWVEGASNSGEGEELNFNFEKTQTIKSIQILNGYHRSEPHLEMNAAIKEVEIYSDDKSIGTFSITKDYKKYSKIDLKDAIKTKNLKLKIKSIIPGT